MNEYCLPWYFLRVADIIDVSHLQICAVPELNAFFEAIHVAWTPNNSRELIYGIFQFRIRAPEEDCTEWLPVCNDAMENHHANAIGFPAT